MNKAELGAAGVNSQARSHTHKVGVWLGLMGVWTGNQTSDTVCHPHTTVICGFEVCFAVWKLEPFINLFLLGQKVWVACRRLGITICLLKWYFTLSVTSVFNYKCVLHADKGDSYMLLEVVDQRDRTFARKRESTGHACLLESGDLIHPSASLSAACQRLGCSTSPCNSAARNTTSLHLQAVEKEQGEAFPVWRGNYNSLMNLLLSDPSFKTVVLMIFFWVNIDNIYMDS